MSNPNEKVFFALSRFQYLQGHESFREFMTWVFDIPGGHEVYSEGEQVFIRFSESAPTGSGLDCLSFKEFADVFDDEDTAHHFFKMTEKQPNRYLTDPEVEDLINQLGHTVASKYDLFKLADLMQAAIHDKRKIGGAE